MDDLSRRQFLSVAASAAGAAMVPLDVLAADPAAVPTARGGPLLGSPDFYPAPERPIGWRADGTGRFPAVDAGERKNFADLKPKVEQLDEACTELPALINETISPDGMKADRNEALDRKIKDKCDLEWAIQQAMARVDRRKYNAWNNDADWSKYTPTSDGKYVWAAFWGGNKGIGANVVVCFDLNGKRIWSRFCGQTDISEHGTHSSPALCGDYLVFKTGAALFGFEKATGKMAWQNEIEGGIGASTCLGGKHIFVRDDQGQTLVLEPGPKYKELAKNLLVEYDIKGTQPEAQSNFFFEGPRIYFRTRGFMYCIGEK